MNIAALSSGFPTASAETADDACVCELPPISQEEIEAFKSQFPDRYEEDQIAVAAALPTAVDLSASPYFPPIGGPQGTGNCTSWSTTYYQYTFAANKLNNATSTAETAYSPRWTYNWLNGGRYIGIKYTNAYQVLMRQGGLTMAECPERKSNGTYDYSISTDTEAMVNALGTRLSFYGEIIIDTESNPITSPTDTALNTVKMYLNNGYILQVNANWSWIYDNSTKTITGSVSNGETAVYQGYNGSNISGHALVVVGYDDRIECDIDGDGVIESGEKGAFKVANSHGTSSFNDGFVWVMYDALNATSNYASHVNRVPAFYYYCSDTSNQFNYIEVDNYDVNLVALFTINTTNIYNYDFTAARNEYSSFPSDASKQYVCYDASDSKTVDSSSVTAYNGTIAFDFGSLDDPASCFTGTTSYYWGLQMSVIDRDASTETVSSCIYADNLLNPIKTARLPSSYTTTWYRPSLISLDIGDLNYDSSLTADDADLLLEFLTRTSELSDLQLHLADYNEDGAVSMTDLTALNGALPASEQALLRESAAELYSSLSVEKQIEMNQMFTELQTALSVDLDLVTA